MADKNPFDPLEIPAFLRRNPPPPRPAPKCEHCHDSKIEEVYGGHGSVLELPCSYCVTP